MKRLPVQFEFNERAIKIVKNKLIERLKRKGNGSFYSRHESFGIIAEEFDELWDELRSNNKQKFKNELIDVAVACLFSIACLEAKTME